MLINCAFVTENNNPFDIGEGKDSLQIFLKQSTLYFSFSLWPKSFFWIKNLSVIKSYQNSSLLQEDFLSDKQNISPIFN